jgi:hypothetical protein
LNEVKDFAQGRMIWARALKKVRNADSVILSAACAEIDRMYVDGVDFVLEVNETQYSLLSQTEHLKTLSKIINEEGNLRLKLAKTAEKVTSVDDDIKQLQHIIGNDKLQIR